MKITPQRKFRSAAPGLVILPPCIGELNLQFLNDMKEPDDIYQRERDYLTMQKDFEQREENEILNVI